MLPMSMTFGAAVAMKILDHDPDPAEPVTFNSSWKLPLQNCLRGTKNFDLLFLLGRSPTTSSGLW